MLTFPVMTYWIKNHDCQVLEKNACLGIIKYNLVRRDRIGRVGGVSIYIRANFNCTYITQLTI